MTPEELVGRTQALARLGFPDADSYFLSPTWGRIRDRVLLLAGYKCQRCPGARARRVQVLRWNADVLTGEDIFGLRALCKDCFQREASKALSEVRDSADLTVTEQRLVVKLRRREQKMKRTLYFRKKAAVRKASKWKGVGKKLPPRELPGVRFERS